MNWLLSAIAGLVLLSATGFADQQSDFEAVKRGLTELFLTGTAPDYFVDATDRFKLPSLFRHGKHETAYDVSQVCSLCNLVVDLLILERYLGASGRTMSLEVKYACTRLGIENERVCSGVVDEYLAIVLYVIDNKPDLSSDRFCGTVLQSAGCEPNADHFNWSIDLPGGASPERPGLNATSPNPLRIAHFSDVHYDPIYRVGGNPNCGEPICCQEDQGDPDPSVEGCGYWTDYRDGDTPWQLVEETVFQVNSTDIDYVYYTGDTISHRVWDTSVEGNSRDLTRLHEYFRESFGVPVFPVLGNHEPHPLNVWAPEDVTDELLSVQWLFQLAADLWVPWLGEETRETILKGGYYSVSPREGFRIIGINSALGYNENWWLMLEDFDPFGQLQWLADTLKLAEDNNESVHILGHVPTGSSAMLKVWSREYFRIVERFQNTITGQFNGDSHHDEFHVYYSSSEPLRPIGASFNGASVTPSSSSNPALKYYFVDPVTFTVQDYEEWTFDLALANTQPPTQSPQWYRLYSFAETYGAQNLQPAEVGAVVERMARNHSLLDKYYRYKFRNALPGIGPGCDRACQRGELCNIVIAEVGDRTQCDYYSALFEHYV